MPGALGVNSAGGAGGGGGGGGPGTVNGQQPNQPLQGDQFSSPTNATIMSDAVNGTMPTNTTELTTTTTTLAPPQDDDVEGSGDDEDDDGGDVSSFFSLGSLLTRAALFRSFPTHQSRRTGRQFYSSCSDRITMPCIIEDFISAGMGSVPTCSPVHCGSSLCPGGNLPCRVESTVTPFGLGIHFGDGTFKGSPEDNIGACIRYNQLACV